MKHDVRDRTLPKPILEPQPSAGQVVVTRFECHSLLAMLVIRLLHIRIKRDVRRMADGFVGAWILPRWRERTLLSVTLWRDLNSVYSMGTVSRHVHAARLPAKLGVRTACGVFCYAGDWTRVMFGSPAPARSPLHPLSVDDTPQWKGMEQP